MRIRPLVFGLSLLWAQSQSAKGFWEQLHPYFGAGVTFIDIRFLNQPLFDYAPRFWSVGAGANYIYYRDANDFLAIGPGAQVMGAFRFLGSYGANWMLQIPIYAFARLGATATPYNRQRLGVGLAAGFRYTTFQTTYTIVTTSSYVGKIRQSFLNPTLMLDFTLNIQRLNPTTVCLYLDVLPARRNTEIYGSFDPVPLEYRTWGLSLHHFLSR